MLNLLEIILQLLHALVYQGISLRRLLIITLFFAPFFTSIGLFIVARYYAGEKLSIWIIACALSWVCFFTMMIRKKYWTEED